MIDRYRKRIAAMAVELAREDPALVKAVVARLRAAGEIEPDDLVYLERIANAWIAIAAQHRPTAPPRPPQYRVLDASAFPIAPRSPS